MGYRVQGIEVTSFGCKWYLPKYIRVWGLGFGVWGLGFRVKM